MIQERILNMSDNPIITVGTATLKLQTGLQPTDKQWCELAHIRAFSSTGEDITGQVQIDVQQVNFETTGTYQVQAFVSDPETHKIAGQRFNVQLISLEDNASSAPTPTKIQSEPQPAAIQSTTAAKPAPSQSQAPTAKQARQAAKAEKKAAKTAYKNTKENKSHKHFMWTVLTLVLGILLMWLLIYIFSGGTNSASQSSSVTADTSSSATTSSSEAASTDSSASETSTTSTAAELAQLTSVVKDLRQAVSDYKSSNDASAYQSQLAEVQTSLQTIATESAANNEKLAEVATQLSDKVTTMAAADSPTEASSELKDATTSSLINSVKALF